ncbi:MAG: hypothetical protein H6700_00765 [Myxococcales bacterium]|nr:hypothetical protein [Myxococcales bacterium]
MKKLTLLAVLLWSLPSVGCDDGPVFVLPAADATSVGDGSGETDVELPDGDLPDAATDATGDDAEGDGDVAAIDADDVANTDVDDDSGDPAVSTDPDVDVEPDADRDTAVDPDVGTDPDAAADPDVARDPDVAGDPDVARDTEVGSDPDVAADPDVARDTEVGSDPDVEVASDPDTARDADADADADAGVCTGLGEFLGQIGGDAPGGGTAVYGTRPWATIYPNGNLSAVLAVVPAAGGTETAETETSVTVTRARVIATGFTSASNQQFVVADRNAALHVYLPLDGTLAPPFDIRVGQDVSFVATRVQRFNGRPTILRATGFTLLSENQPIAIDDSGRALTSADVNELVSVSGVIESYLGDCGGPSCYELRYGTRLVQLRTRSTLATVGGCLSYVGPVSTYADVVQLDTVNFDWVWFW